MIKHNESADPLTWRNKKGNKKWSVTNENQLHKIIMIDCHEPLIIPVTGIERKMNTVPCV